MSKTEEIKKYIRSIRNKDKKEYAIEYAKWTKFGGTNDFPRSKKISAMAEQAVFMHINKILGR